ncbi:secreted RxLR effector protein 161-like [Jatropha curcas]|uniref:secreted RxLR effector protein 161-like n=1 Tax=Jatropha curcas TaxID=180498 RepID=UPI0018952F04|nr:secreted RxLR effector protein 161-like [Jatropha curcas]
MHDCKGLSTPAAITENVQDNSSLSAEDSNLFQVIIGALQYLSLTRPDVSFSVHHLSQFVHCPSIKHWCAVKRILRYLQQTKDHGLHITRSSHFHIHAYTDATWTSDVIDRKSISGMTVYVGTNLISWATKKQKLVARSSTEAEYRALGTVTAEITWLLSLINEIGLPNPSPPTIWCDNIGRELRIFSANRVISFSR